MRAERVKQLLEDKFQLHGAYQRVFESPEGKIVLRHLLKVGFVTKSTFVAGDPQQTALNEGSRRLVLSILKFTKKTPHELITEIEESI